MKQIQVVGVIGSPKREGNTAPLVRRAMQGAREGGAEIMEIFLADCRIEYCRGCMHCLKAGRCAIDDDFSGIRDTLYKADGIIWGTPTYGNSVNAIMKNLMDRLGMYEVMTSSLGGKHMAAISTAGSASAARKTAKSLALLLGGGIFLTSGISGILGAGYSKNTTAAEKEAAKDNAYSLGSKLARDIKADRKYPLQNFFVRMVNRFFVRNIFIKFIQGDRENDTKAVYENLLFRGLIKNPG